MMRRRNRAKMSWPGWPNCDSISVTGVGPPKPLLMLLALGRLATTGSSTLPWSEAQVQLGNLIAEFGPASKTSRTQSAAYPFTRLRSDGIWVLDQEVPMDSLGPLAARHVTGRLAPVVEKLLADDPGLV